MGNNRDNLSGTTFKSILFFVYMLPGMILLWLNYMNPKGGIAGVAKSSRHARSPVMTFITSTLVWTVVAYYFLPEENKIIIMNLFDKLLKSI